MRGNSEFLLHVGSHPPFERRFAQTFRYGDRAMELHNEAFGSERLDVASHSFLGNRQFVGKFADAAGTTLRHRSQDLGLPLRRVHHGAPIKYEGEWVEFPEYTDACYNDPSWGSNPDLAYDCGKPRGWIKKVGWKGGEAKWPGAYKAIRNFKIDNKTMGNLIVEIDLEGKKLDAVVGRWLKDNEATWKKWTQ